MPSRISAGHQPLFAAVLLVSLAPAWAADADEAPKTLSRIAVAAEEEPTYAEKDASTGSKTDAPIKDIINGKGQSRTRVRTDQPDRLMNALAGDGVSAELQDRELLEVKGTDPRRIAQTALEHQVLIYELTPLQASLEEAYMELTKDAVEYHSLTTTGAPVPAQPGGK